MQQQSKLGGDEPMTTEPVRLHMKLEILDPVLAFSASYVPVVEFLRLIGAATHHKAGVGPLLHGLRLVDNPAFVLPTSSLVEAFGEQPGLLAFGLIAIFSFAEQALGERLQARVGDQAHGVVDTLSLAVLVKGGYRKARVRPQLDLNLRPSLPQTSHDALKDRHRGAA